jgi:hypothetical protein
MIRCIGKEGWALPMKLYHVHEARMFSPKILYLNILLLGIRALMCSTYGIWSEMGLVGVYTCVAGKDRVHLGLVKTQ